MNDDLANSISGTVPSGVSIVFEPGVRNCSVVFDVGIHFQGVIRFRGSDSTVKIGAFSEFVDAYIVLGVSSSVSIGQHLWAGQKLEITTAEGAEVSIGDWCLIGAYCDIRGDDSHPFYDRETGDRLNPSATVLIADKVWLGRRIGVMPGSNIGEGSVIGYGAVVTSASPIPAHSVAVGVPARVLHSNIKWVRKHLQHDRDIPSVVARE